MTVGLLLICTGKYEQFIAPLLQSAEKHFFNGFKINVYLFSDQPIYIYNSERIKAHVKLIKRKGFPYDSLYRYKHFISRNYDCDYLFYCDVDMMFVEGVGLEILPDDNERLTAVQHPGFWQGGWGSPSTHKQSTAWLEPERRKQYVAGGFQGGITKDYLEACKMLAHNIDMDEESGIMAEWHDETHWNWYIANYGKAKILNPSYCFPEASWAAKLPFRPKLKALEKDHKFVRT